ncbi:Protein Y71F9B.13 a [Aphelenchoides avenae]|nr:Protein Y71F9B.13 a [Aphelenchus avenae]
MCDAFAKFAARWNPIPETLVAWTKENCDRIQPRPKDMTCQDIVKFATDCNYGRGGPRMTQAERQAYELMLSERYYQKHHGFNRPAVLPRYQPWNRQTAYDFGAYGNWYYPNYYPGTYINDFEGSRDTYRRLENEYSWTRGSHFPYTRADNIVNIGLQQTWAPTCLHDLFFCVRATYMDPKKNYRSSDGPSRAYGNAKEIGPVGRRKRSLRNLRQLLNVQI